MNPEEARARLESLKAGYSENNFFKYVQSGNQEVVELFIDAGMSPDLRNSAGDPAILIASKSRNLNIIRLLMARGASLEPLLVPEPRAKDKWDKLTAASGLLSFFSALLVAAVGGYFTYSYNQRQRSI